MSRSGITPSSSTPGLVGPVRAPALHLMSWNIRRPLPALVARPADRWAARIPRLRAMLETEMPTVLCAQEVHPEQIPVVTGALGGDHRFVGHGRAADATGEACPVFYDAARLELLGWSQTALSDTPSVPGSRSWGNLFPRVVVHAEFRDRVTSRRLRVLNTHFDPVSARSRKRSAEAVRELLPAAGVPAVVAGDLNAGPSSPAVRLLLADGVPRDSWTAARERRTENWGTYAGYREPRKGGARIDWILVTGGVEVTHAAINPRTHRGGWPSDHLPVQAVLRLEEKGPGQA